MPETEGLPRLLSIGHLAERLGTTPRHVRRLVAERRVPFLKVGRLVQFDPDNITNWLDGRRVRGLEEIGGWSTKAVQLDS
jgi:excisionase family DNA binding protein